MQKRKDELDQMKKRSLQLDRATISISKQADVVLMKSVPKGRAYLGAFQTYAINPVPKHQFSYDRFFRDSKPEIKKLLQQKLNQLKGLKFSLSYLGYFVIAGTSDHDCEEQKRSKNFPIFAPIEIVANHIISPAVDSMFSKIDKMINDFQDNKSGWVFYENFRLDINIFKYNAIQGSSYIRLPDIISRKKACINIENMD